MAPPKKQSQAMPSMKELQDLLAQLDAEGGLAIGGGEDAGKQPGRESCLSRNPSNTQE